MLLDLSWVACCRGIVVFWRWLNACFKNGWFCVELEEEGSKRHLYGTQRDKPGRCEWVEVQTEEEGWPFRCIYGLVGLQGR
jgi:hypothetical protein